MMLLPGRTLVPTIARDDVGATVLVDIRDGKRLTRTGVDHVICKSDIGVAAGSGEQHGSREKNSLFEHRNCWPHSSRDDFILRIANRNTRDREALELAFGFDILSSSLNKRLSRRLR